MQLAGGRDVPACSWRDVVTYLRAAGEPDDEVEAEEKTDEDLSVLLDPRELIAQSRDDRLGAAELQTT